MSATVFTTIATFFQVMCCKNQKTIFVKVVIFSFSFKRGLLL